MSGNENAKSKESPCKTPERCAICLAPPENKAVLESCLHAFCFGCLKEWSKIKAECPLCKHPFKHFIYNVRANDDYDKFVVPAPVPRSTDDLDYFQRYLHWERETNHVVDHWMSSRISEWRERMQLEQENSRAATVAATNVELIRRRRRFYREGTQVSHVNNNRQVREISSHFFRANPPQVHRLAPWLKRELIVLFGANNMMLVNRVCDLILSAVSTLGIQSADFYDEIKAYFCGQTDHFLKEFISFARSPHDLPTYDSNACYKKRRRRRRRHNNSWSSDDDDYSALPRDLFPPYHRRGNFAEPPPLAHVRNCVPLERRANRRRPTRSRTPDEVVIVSSSPESRQPGRSLQSSDEDDVEFVKYIKPPHLRTPEAFIDLDSSDVSPPHLSNSNWSSSEDGDIRVSVKSVVVPVYKDNDQLPSTSATYRVDEKPRACAKPSTSEWKNEFVQIKPSPCSRSNSDTKRETSEYKTSTGGTSASAEPSLRNTTVTKTFHKVFERKLSSAISRSFSRHRVSCSSESCSSDDDYATPYVSSAFSAKGSRYSRHRPG